jgi:hypothetical protein
MSRRPARVPHLDHDALSANSTPAEARTPSQREARALVERLVGELLEADDNVLRFQWEQLRAQRADIAHRARRSHAARRQRARLHQRVARH